MSPRTRTAPLLAVAALLTLALPFFALPAAGAARAEEPQARTPEAQAGSPAPLSAKHKEWLELVAPLIDAKERETFLALKRDYQRDAFIRRFWELRDPYPQTQRNELRERWEERAQVAREQIGSLTED